MRRKFNIIIGNQQGFTLIEVLIAVAVLGAITGIMAMTFNMVTRTTTTGTAQNLMMSQVNQAANWIARDIESASSVMTDNGTVLCSIQRYVWDGDDITSSTTIDYVVNNGMLRRKVNGSEGTPIAQFISYPDPYTKVEHASENNTYIIKLRSVYKNSEYRQEFKANQRAP